MTSNNSDFFPNSKTGGYTHTRIFIVMKKCCVNNRNTFFFNSWDKKWASRKIFPHKVSLRDKLLKYSQPTVPLLTLTPAALYLWRPRKPIRNVEDLRAWVSELKRDGRNQGCSNFADWVKKGDNWNTNKAYPFDFSSSSSSTLKEWL